MGIAASCPVRLFPALVHIDAYHGQSHMAPLERYTKIQGIQQNDRPLFSLERDSLELAMYVRCAVYSFDWTSGRVCCPIFVKEKTTVKNQK